MRPNGEGGAQVRRRECRCFSRPAAFISCHFPSIPQHTCPPHSRLALAPSPSTPPTLSIWPRGRLLPLPCCRLLLPEVPRPPGRASSVALPGRAAGLLLPIGRQQENLENGTSKVTEGKIREERNHLLLNVASSLCVSEVQKLKETNHWHERGDDFDICLSLSMTFSCANCAPVFGCRLYYEPLFLSLCCLSCAAILTFPFLQHRHTILFLHHLSSSIADEATERTLYFLIR